MNSLEFINFTIEHWMSLLSWAIFYMFLLFYIFKNIVPAKKYDPFQFYVIFNLGTGYSVLTSLFQFGHVDIKIFLILVLFAFVLITSLYYFLVSPIPVVKKLIKFCFSPVRKGKVEIYIVCIIYIILSVLILLSSGLGALADSNRFEQARGYGVFIRVLDLFRLIILAYLGLNFVKQKKSVLSYFQLIILAFFLLFSSLMGGAKFALLEGLFVIAVAIHKFKGEIKISPFLTTSIIALATGFALLVVSLNSKNDDNLVGVYDDQTNVLVQKLVARILANGDTYYGSLPNQVYSKLETDPVWVRFLSPIIGVTQTSALVGYPVENYSVGRAILLYHDPSNDVSGGPVSHYDLFSYVYFNVFGILFILFLSFIIAQIAFYLSISKNIYFLSITSALWTRCLAMLLEPTVGLAYVLDTFILISVVKVIAFIVYNLPKKIN
jgi:hypothetical protein